MKFLCRYVNLFKCVFNCQKSYSLGGNTSLDKMKCWQQFETNDRVDNIWHQNVINMEHQIYSLITFKM